jgi:hypothetical protein
LVAVTVGSQTPGIRRRRQAIQFYLEHARSPDVGQLTSMGRKENVRKRSGLHSRQDKAACGGLRGEMKCSYRDQARGQSGVVGNSGQWWCELGPPQGVKKEVARREGFATPGKRQENEWQFWWQFDLRKGRISSYSTVLVVNTKAHVTYCHVGLLLYLFGSPGKTRTCNLAVNSRSLHH